MGVVDVRGATGRYADWHCVAQERNWGGWVFQSPSKRSGLNAGNERNLQRIPQAERIQWFQRRTARRRNWLQPVGSAPEHSRASHTTSARRFSTLGSGRKKRK